MIIFFYIRLSLIQELPVIMLFPAKEGAETILMDTSEGIDIEV